MEIPTTNNNKKGDRIMGKIQVKYEGWFDVKQGDQYDIIEDLGIHHIGAGSFEPFYKIKDDNGKEISFPGNWCRVMGNFEPKTHKNRR